MGLYEVKEYLKEKGYLDKDGKRTTKGNPLAVVGPLLFWNNSKNNCLACQTRCELCEVLSTLVWKGSYTCVCFTCPECNYRHTEMMIHSPHCEKASEWEKSQKI